MAEPVKSMQTQENDGTVPLVERVLVLAEEDEVVLPPFPEVARRLMDLLSGENEADARQVAKLLHQDPAIASSVLRLANSAVYGGLRRITELHQAVARLGLEQVRSIVTAAVHKGHFEADGEVKRKHLEALWVHALATAVAARHLALAAGADAELHFLAGLFHDIGKLWILRAVDHLQNVEPDLVITGEVMAEMMDTLHAPLGGRLLQTWRLPAEICEAARRHHDDVGADHPVVLRIQAANAMARKLGAHPRPDPDLDVADLPCVELLNLGELELAAMLVDVEDELEEFRRSL